MTIHVSSFPREKRRKLAKQAIQRVKEQGIHKANPKLLMACLFGLATQDQMKDLVLLDSWVLEALEPACRHAGRFYEEIRQELIFRVYTEKRELTSLNLNLPHQHLTQFLGQ